MKCPKCDSAKNVICHGRRHALYPSGCLVVIGPLLATIHQASAPVDYECKGCGLRFGRRSTAAKVALFGILLWVAYLIWITYEDVSTPP